MTEQELEETWLNLGREERRLEEILAATQARLRRYRTDGQHAAADALADAIENLTAELARLKTLIQQAEPLYFAAVNARLRKT